VPGRRHLEAGHERPASVDLGWGDYGISPVEEGCCGALLPVPADRIVPHLRVPRRGVIHFTSAGPLDLLISPAYGHKLGRTDGDRAGGPRFSTNAGGTMGSAGVHLAARDVGLPDAQAKVA
jgi:hypothetical protein